VFHMRSRIHVDKHPRVQLHSIMNYIYTYIIQYHTSRSLRPGLAENHPEMLQNILCVCVCVCVHVSNTLATR
jgi:hypothetical protein